MLCASLWKSFVVQSHRRELIDTWRNKTVSSHIPYTKIRFFLQYKLDSYRTKFCVGVICDLCALGTRAANSMRCRVHVVGAPGPHGSRVPPSTDSPSWTQSADPSRGPRGWMDARRTRPIRGQTNRHYSPDGTSGYLSRTASHRRVATTRCTSLGSSVARVTTLPLGARRGEGGGKGRGKCERITRHNCDRHRYCGVVCVGVHSRCFCSTIFALRSLESRLRKQDSGRK